MVMILSSKIKKLIFVKMQDLPSRLFSAEDKKIIEFKYLELDSLEEVNTLQYSIKNSMRDKELYSPNSISVLEKMLSGHGFIIGIFNNKSLIGICGIAILEEILHLI
jgi:hypothetical protein